MEGGARVWGVQGGETVAGEGGALSIFDPDGKRGRRYNRSVLVTDQNGEVLVLAACLRLDENSRRGFDPDGNQPRWASGFAISQTPLGFQGPLYDTRVGSRYTGKERDAESGLDNFGAHYYGSSMGRFLSPDFGGPGPMADPVPWADLENPQSLNLYGYVNNNPLSNTDDDGHDVSVCSNDGNGGQTCKTISNDQYAAAQKAGNGGLNVPTLNQVGMNGNGSGQFNSNAITDANGNSVGSATYVSNGGADYYANRSGLDYLGGVGAVMNRPSTYAAFYGASALGGAGLVAAGSTAGELTLLGDISLTPTSGEAGYAQRLLAQGGKKSVEKAIRTLGKRLAEHQGKVGNLGGNPGSVEREIAGFTRTIEALKQVLR